MKKLTLLSAIAALTLPVAAHAEMKYEAPSQDYYPGTIPSTEVSGTASHMTSSSSAMSKHEDAADENSESKYVFLKNGTKVGISAGKAWYSKKGVATPLKDGKYTLKDGSKLVVKKGSVVN